MKVSSASSPGANSVTSVTALLEPFFTAQSAMMADDCASVQLVRTKKGDFSTTAVVLDNMITVGFWASVSSGALGMRSAVRPPPMTSTLSLTMSFLDQALAGLAGGGVVLDDQLDLLAGHAVAVLLDVEAGAGDHLLACAASGPVIGMTMPTLTVPCAAALATVAVEMPSGNDSSGQSISSTWLSSVGKIGLCSLARSPDRDGCNPASRGCSLEARFFGHPCSL